MYDVLDELFYPYLVNHTFYTISLLSVLSLNIFPRCFKSNNLFSIIFSYQVRDNSHVHLNVQPLTFFFIHLGNLLVLNESLAEYPYKGIMS